MKLFLIVFTALALAAPSSLLAAGTPQAAPEFVTAMANMPELEQQQGVTTVGEKLAFRAKQQPFLLAASIIFVLAIAHTFVAVPITKKAHKIQHDHDAHVRRQKAAAGVSVKAGDLVSFKATLVHFLGEVEAIFGIWVVVLLAAMAAFYNIGTVESYVMSVNFTEPLFVVVIMALASTRPILRFAESCLSFFARFGRETPAAWWLSLLIVAPLLGSFITEPGAMTIAAMLLAKKFYKLKPSPRFAYATLGLLFVNISVGGLMTNFAAPPVLMVAQKWGLSSKEMFLHFGDKAIIAIVVSTLFYFLFFRKELASMSARIADHDADGKGDVHDELRPIPLFVTLTHLGFMAWTVGFAHYPPIFVGGFLFFLAFQQATSHHQSEVQLRGPILVGFFLAGLVVHGGLQGWWLAPIISSLTEWPLFIGATVLTSFNDNAAITFLASQVSGLAPQLKYAVLAGAVSGGGLTVIANAPNPAGQALLSRFFGEGVSPLKLFLGGFIPTVIAACCMMFIPDPELEKIFDPEIPPVQAVTPVESALATPAANQLPKPF
jgi:hypothetical protein